VVQVQDITERKRFEGQLQYLADHDALTGLFNRRRFEEELDQAVALARRYKRPGALLVIDLDNFKYVNDTYGHAVGDELIGRVAAALRERVRETDVLGRLGGDEFALVLPEVGANDARLVAQELVLALRAGADVVLEGRRIQATASIGIALIEPTDELTGQELLAEADIAMYEAKEAGRDRVSIADPEGGRQDRMRSRLTWSQRIREALENDAFVLCEQPILDLRSGRIRAHELLIRMRGEGGDLIPPSAFLDIAERFGQIQAIDRWVLTQALRILAEEEPRADDHPILQLNLSGSSICDSELTDCITSELANTPLTLRASCSR
jgi:diguanylate cyclase (GGDEF)-like protein